MAVREVSAAQRRWRAVFQAGTVLLAAAILFVCTRPVQTLRAAHYPQINEWFDATNHLIAFAVWNGVLRLGFGHRGAGWMCAVGVMFGAFCEGMQWLIPTRGVQAMDFVANTLPVAFYVFAPGLKSLHQPDGWLWSRLAPAREA